MGYKRIIAINDDVTTCECCGKKNLKKVVWLEDVETYAVMAYGSTCAARANGHDAHMQRCLEKDFEAKQATAEKEQRRREWFARRKVVISDVF